MTGAVDDVDPMLTQWAVYERRLRAFYATRNLPEDKNDYVFGQLRDAFLRRAPTLLELPATVPLEVQQYVADVTGGMLVELAACYGDIYELRQGRSRGSENHLGFPEG